MVAEKFEAAVKLGLLNSRMKDFYDIFLLCSQYEFESEILATAIKATFNHRGTDLVENPIAFTDEFIDDPGKNAQWRAFTKKSRIKNAPNDLKEVISTIESFIIPVAHALIDGKSFIRHWNHSGGWK